MTLGQSLLGVAIGLAIFSANEWWYRRLCQRLAALEARLVARLPETERPQFRTYDFTVLTDPDATGGPRGLLGRPTRWGSPRSGAPSNDDGGRP